MADTNASFLLIEMLKMKRRGLSPARRKRSRAPRIALQWLYPSAQERQYRRYITGLMEQYSETATLQVRNNLSRWLDDRRIDAFRADDFATEFQQLLNELERTQTDMFTPEGKGVEQYNSNSIRNTLMATAVAVSVFNDKQWNKFTRRILGDPLLVAEPWLGEVIQAWANANYRLIKSLTDEYIKKLNTIVADGVLEGRTYDAIMKDLRKMNVSLTKKRARLLSRDQVGKLNGALSKRRQQEAGLDLYRWLTARDERVRSTHKALHNKICRWDDSSVYADNLAEATGDNWSRRSTIRAYEGIPGQDIQCRCTAVPMFDDIFEQVDSELEDEMPR
jgi:SPP1 gp7 family putative phage head morphogenesis protein